MPKDAAKSFKYYLIGAEHGDVRSEYKVGRYYEAGKGTDKNLPEAFKWTLKAAASMSDDLDGEAKLALARMYEHGWGVERNPQVAADWYAVSGQDGAGLALGQLYLDGDGVPKDAALAVPRIRWDAVRGVVPAQVKLADLYAKGDRVPRNEARAIYWYHAAAAKGSERAKAALARYEKKVGPVAAAATAAMIAYRQQRYRDAITLVRAPADKGNPVAQTLLGQLMLARDSSFEKHGIHYDLAKARSLFEAAAKQGNADAVYNLGLLYWNGTGVKKDPAKGLALFIKAANLGSAQAASHLGDIYREGKGVTRNADTALNWYRKGAEAGDDVSAYFAGAALKSGKGATKDLAKAARMVQNFGVARRLGGRTRARRNV